MSSSDRLRRSTRSSKAIPGDCRIQAVCGDSQYRTGHSGSTRRRRRQKLDGNIRFDHVTFGYEAGKTVLSNINLSVTAGETVAFVGPSGAGKTTLCSLIPRFYDVDAGQITIDGMDIRRMTRASSPTDRHCPAGCLSLFWNTGENIAYGKLDASEDEIWEAARRTQLDGFIRNQPEGLETVIGERGVKLSGGQKQRLAIARMFLKNPPVLIWMKRLPHSIPPQKSRSNRHLSNYLRAHHACHCPSSGHNQEC